MNTSNEPKATTVQQPEKNNKNVIIGVLAAAILAMGIYLVVDKNKTGKVMDQQQSEIATVSTEKSNLQNSFDGSLARLDSMSTTNAELNSKLLEKNSEITKTKTEIRNILNNKNATTAELSRAKTLIASLNDKISSMQAEVARLTQDNQTLTQDKVVLSQEKEKLNVDLTATNVIKDELAKKVDIASTLNASNISITPLKVKGSGTEKVTTTAKKVDKFLISFDVSNRIAQAGTTDLFVCITGPDGKEITSEALGSGTFMTRDDGTKPFTTKLAVDVETGKRKTVQFSFAPVAKFQEGKYNIKIFQNGFMIGEGTRELKKGGLFS